MELHSGMIRHLSACLNIPENAVMKLYEIILRRYKARARVKDFLVVITGKRVERVLKIRYRRAEEIRY